MKKLSLEELNRLSVEEFKEAPKLPIVLLLDHVRSLHNVGSAFRTADAFRAEKIWLTGITGTPPHREIEKTALGATDSVQWAYHKDPVQVAKALQQDGYELIMIEQTSTSTPLHLFEPNPRGRYALVFGNEVNGITDEVLALSNTAIEIPQSGTKHSLNIAVCLGIVLWEFYKKLSV